MFLSERGVATVSGGSVESVIAQPIQPFFAPGNPFTLNKATAVYWAKQKLLILYSPVVTDEYSDDETSICIVYDTWNNAFYTWSNINMLGGAIVWQGNLAFSRRSIVSSLIQTNFAAFNQLGTTDDYADHNLAISLKYVTQWESNTAEPTQANPSPFKRFQKIKLMCLDTTLSNFETPTFTIDIAEEHNYFNVPTGIQTINFSSTLLGYGAEPWGLFPWGEPRMVSVLARLTNVKTHAMSLVFSNSNINENILISGYELEEIVNYASEIKE
jgi:hypothetical protein